MMRLELADLRADPETLDNSTDLVVNLEADVRLEVDGDVIYEEVHFPVVELASALTRWSQTPPEGRSDFEFDSMFAEEPGLLWIRRVDDGWRVGSIHQERAELRALTPAEIDDFVEAFVSDLSNQVRTMYGPVVATHFEQALRAAP